MHIKPQKFFQNILQESINLHSLVQATSRDREPSIQWVLDQAEKHLTADQYLIVVGAMLEKKYDWDIHRMTDLYGISSIFQLGDLYRRSIETLKEKLDGRGHPFLTHSDLFLDLAIGRFDFVSQENIDPEWFGRNYDSAMPRLKFAEKYLSKAQYYALATSFYAGEYGVSTAEVAEDLGVTPELVAEFKNRTITLVSNFVSYDKGFDKSREREESLNAIRYEPKVVSNMKKIAEEHLNTREYHILNARHFTPVEEIMTLEELAASIFKTVGTLKYLQSATMRKFKGILKEEAPHLIDHPILSPKRENVGSYDAPHIQDHEVQEDPLTKEIFNLSRYMLLPRNFYMLGKSNFVKGDFSLLHEQIGEKLDLPKNTVKSTVTTRIKKTMRELLNVNGHRSLKDHPYFNGKGKKQMPDWLSDYEGVSQPFIDMLTYIDETIEKCMHPQQRYYYIQTHLRSATNKILPEELAQDAAVLTSHVIAVISEGKEKLKDFVARGKCPELLKYPLLARKQKYLKDYGFPSFALPAIADMDVTAQESGAHAMLLFQPEVYAVYAHNELVSQDHRIEACDLRRIFELADTERPATLHISRQVIAEATETFPAVFEKKAEDKKIQNRLVVL